MALRVPKAYAVAAGLKLGQKVDIGLPKTQLPVAPLARRRAVVRAMKELQAMHAFENIKDPVAWQREIRQDRPLPGRG